MLARADRVITLLDCVPFTTMTSAFESNKLGSEVRNLLDSVLRPSPLNSNGLSLNIAKVSQPGDRQAENWVTQANCRSDRATRAIMLFVRGQRRLVA